MTSANFHATDCILLYIYIVCIRTESGDPEEEEATLRSDCSILSLWIIVFSYCSMILRIGTCARSLISSQSLRFSSRGFQYLMILRGLFWRKEWNGYTRWEGTWYRAGSDSVKDCCAFLERVLVSSLSQISENFVPRRYLFSFQNLAQYVCISNAWCWLTMMRSGILDPGT